MLVYKRAILVLSGPPGMVTCAASAQEHIAIWATFSTEQGEVPNLNEE
jgi:hypothetical protein